MCFGTISVPICARALFRCSYVPRHHSSANIFPGTLPVPISALASFRCPCIYWTKVVPGQTWASEWCLGTCGHRSGAQEHVGTGMVPGQIWAQEWCPGTYEHRKGAREQICTKMVSLHIWAPDWCQATYGALAHMGNGRVPAHILAPKAFLGTYWHHYGDLARMDMRMVPG